MQLINMDICTKSEFVKRYAEVEGRGKEELRTYRYGECFSGPKILGDYISYPELGERN